jgi:hypothetical protein
VNGYMLGGEYERKRKLLQLAGFDAKIEYDARN